MLSLPIEDIHTSSPLSVPLIAIFHTSTYPLRSKSKVSFKMSLTSFPIVSSTSTSASSSPRSPSLPSPSPMPSSSASSTLSPSPTKPTKPGSHLLEYFIAGGTAGAMSRTVVSPLERLKIILSVTFLKTLYKTSHISPHAQKLI